MTSSQKSHPCFNSIELNLPGPHSVLIVFLLKDKKTYHEDLVFVPVTCTFDMKCMFVLYTLYLCLGEIDDFIRFSMMKNICSRKITIIIRWQY